MWHALLDAAPRREALDAAWSIVEELVGGAAEVVDPWSAAQRALVLVEHGRLTGDHRFARDAEALAEHAARLTASTAMDARFIKGFVGVGWLFEAMQDAPPDAELPEDLDDSDEIDDAVAKLLDRRPRPSTAYFDLVSGLVGMGVYFFGRPPSPRNRARLEEIVYRLEESAEYLDDGIAWWGHSVLAPGRGVDGFNLGLAHGVPGIVAFLARALARGIAPARTRMLLEGAVQWVLAQRMPDGPSRYPTVCTERGPDGPARAAWCYGDPGVALALMAAGSAADRPDWEAAAVELARGAAARPIESCQVGDASVCHGAAGLLHVFNRLYQASGDRALRDAAIFWLGPTLRLLADGRWDGVPGADDLPSAKESSILEGKAGIALALLAAASDRAPIWDAMILADIDPMALLRARVVA